MAIKNLVPRLAERGKIKIGIKGELKKSDRGKQFCEPKKLDHFIITTMDRDQVGRLIEDREMMRRLAPNGGKIKEIPVRLLYDDPDLNFPTHLACYLGNRCVCQGDGEVAQRLTQEGKYAEVECPCGRNHPDYQGSDKCKLNGTLSVLMEGAERVGGVWKFRTTSWNTANDMLSSMTLIRFITGGVLARIPLRMVLRSKTVTAPGKGPNQVIYIVNLEYAGSEEELANIGYEIRRKQIGHKVRMNRIEADARKLLSYQLEPPEEQADIQQEFYPEGVILKEEASIEDPREVQQNTLCHPSILAEEQVLIPPGYEGLGPSPAYEPQMNELF